MANQKQADLDKKYFRVLKLVKGGMTKQAAMEKVDMHASTFYKRAAAGLTEGDAPVTPKRKKYTRRAAAVTLEIPEPSTESRVAVFVGTPSQVADAVKGLL